MATTTLDTTRYRILREFPGPGGIKFAPGEIVDASEWRDRNINNLVEGRYMQPIFEEEGQIPRDLLMSMQKRVDELSKRVDELEATIVSLEGQEIAKNKPGPRPRRSRTNG